MFNISGAEFAILIFLALVLIGPERLPEYAAQLARLVKSLKEMMSGAKTTLKEELGEDFDELQKFDPRQYDPRRIVREALLEDVIPPTKPTSGPASAVSAAAAAAAPVVTAPALPGEGTEDASTSEAPATVPFDDEAT